MAKRFAIIIESGNVKGLRDLPGARQDAENWRSFLMSDLGGAWIDKVEICVVNKPKIASIQTLLRQHANDYVFLAFSGHGFEECNSSLKKSVPKICLNDDEQSVDVDLISPASFGTAVFDSCRGVENVRAHISIANESVALNKTIFFSQKTAMDSLPRMLNAANTNSQTVKQLFLRRLDCKQIYDVVRMYSCSSNESAEDFEGDANAGGYYTTFLLRGAKAWQEKRRNIQYYDVYTTKQAHDFACEAMRERNPQQHPEYSPDWQSYPFAIG